MKEVTLDMAAGMQLIVKRCFPHANRVVDRFHDVGNFSKMFYKLSITISFVLEFYLIM